MKQQNKYANSIIYMIRHKDKTIKDFYIGSTLKFNRRRKEHARDSTHAPRGVYCFIRDHGGWDNFEMIKLNDVIAKDLQDLLTIETQYIVEWGADLNERLPIRSKAHRKEVTNAYSRLQYYKRKNSEVYLDYQARTKDKQAEYHKARRKTPEYKAMWSAKLTCECGAVVTRNSIRSHRRTEAHAKRLYEKVILNKVHVPRPSARSSIVCECGCKLADRSNIKNHTRTRKHIQLMAKMGKQVPIVEQFKIFR